MIAWSTLPLGFILAAPTAPLFKPLLANGGVLAGAVGALIGSGDGRWTGLG